MSRWPLDLGRRWRPRPIAVGLDEVDLPDPTFQFEIDDSRPLFAVSAWECHLPVGLFSVDFDFLHLRFPDLLEPVGIFQAVRKYLQHLRDEGWLVLNDLPNDHK